MLTNTQIVAALALLVSVLSFGLSFMQVLIQRIHNKKTVTPIGQIDLGDLPEIIYVYVSNNGTGPLILKKLTFHKGGKYYFDIVDCLDLDKKAYNHVTINNEVSKAILPAKHFTVFELSYDTHSEDFKTSLRKKIAEISMEAEYRDVYGTKYKVKRDFGWFTRHPPVEKINSDVEP